MSIARIAVFALILAIHAGVVAPALAVCKTDECKKAIKWKSGLTAILLREGLDAKEYAIALSAIDKAKGTVAIESSRVLLTWFRREPAPALFEASTGIALVSAGPVVLTRVADIDDDGIALLAFFNRVASGKYEDHVEAGLKVRGEPLAGCVSGLPTHRATLAKPDGEQKTPDLAQLPDPTRLRFSVGPTFDYRQPWQNPDMRGRVRVNYFKLDSDGSIDPNLYSWSYGDSINADDQVFGAFAFWADEAYYRNVTLSFTVKQYTRGGLQRWQNWFRIPYEPITRPHTDDFRWMNSVLSHLGYGASPVTRETVYIKNDSFNAASKTSDTSVPPFDRAFSLYLVYNPPPAPSRFTNGKNAFALFDGPHATVLWNSAGWGGNNMGRVVTHETGHIFWACDEYYDAARNEGCFDCEVCIFGTGPRPNLPNRNCDYPDGGCLSQKVYCMMKENDPVLCPDTPAQVGW